MRRASWRALARRLGEDSGGNMVLFVAGMLATIVALGLGVDYGRAAGLQSRLAAAGHAAAMAAVSPALMAQDPLVAQAQVSSQFAGQVSGLAGLGFDPQRDLVVTVGASASGGRVAVVRWNARYATLFGGLFGAGSLPIAGSAQASADGAPNIDFTVLVLGSPAQSPGPPFGLALGAVGKGGANGNLQQAAQGLIPLARQISAQKGVVYKMDIVSSDTASNGNGSGGLGLSSLFGALTDVNQLLASGVTGGGDIPQGNAYGVLGKCLPFPPCPAPSTSASASYGAALDAINAAMAAPGDGARPTGAQALILLATDGSPGVPGADDLASCAAIKSRGIAIAVFYAPAASAAGRFGGLGGWGLPGGAGQDAVAAGLRGCASMQQGGVALFLQQDAAQTTSEAMAALFSLAAGNAHLVH